jgi:pyruvate dehydrogenase E1 component
MIPFYIYYSMFGFQRIGDLVWAAGDMRTRGFMLGGTAGRTTLNGEGLQHQDGHSHLLFHVVPNVRCYDPAYGYEIATIIRDGIQKMYYENQDIFYYLTLQNEPYRHPPKPVGCDEGILRGAYKLAAAPSPRKHRVQLLGSASSSKRSRCWPKSTMSRRMSGPSPVTRSCDAMPWRPSDGTCCTPAPSSACLT